MNYETINNKNTVKGICKAVLSRLINSVKSNKFIGNQLLNLIRLIEKYIESSVRVVRNSY